MNYFQKCIECFKSICIHKWYVFLACCEAGIPFRGIIHDMSKFNPIEFFNSVKYYTENRSSIDNEKDEKGYSYAWLHHRGRNPHHWEYWIDNFSSGGEALKIPKKYVIEMICDWISLSKVNSKSNWNYSDPFDRFIYLYNRREIIINIETYNVIFNILKLYSKGHYLNYCIKQSFNNY